ncbi:MAG TPA: Rieske 2Fe-2S domain-containing protein [Chloroflexota bacterium]|nr:Rieske 2Fe-2S domain-containing protein [Chloroflexota bacterium]
MQKAFRSARSAPSFRAWQPYLDAALGFRNHWYPAFFGAELAEGECRGQQLLGEPILFKRAGGSVYALPDRCAHRGTPFSVRPECYTRNTITCWYHGFTYDVRDGRLVAVVTDPESALIGKLSLKSYPVQEQKGIVFVFVGDIEPPPLIEDVQPGFLDEALAVLPVGDADVVKSNWRLAAENGVDAAHIYIHRNSELVEATGMTLPLGILPGSREGMVSAAPGGPKGIVKGGKEIPIWDADIETARVSARNRPGMGKNRVNPDVSLWLPCGLKVDPSPGASEIPGMIHFEWYVPVDEHSHRYLVTWGKHVGSQQEAETFYGDVETKWRSIIRRFNDDDIAAREAMERFYAEEDGWHRERLFRPDVVITEWRKLASKHNRGIQRAVAE